MGMRYLSNIKAIAVFTAVALCSCQKPEEELVKDDDIKMVTLTVTSDMPSLDGMVEGKSKTLWDSSTIAWSSGDQIAVGVVHDHAWQKDLYSSNILETEF